MMSEDKSFENYMSRLNRVFNCLSTMVGYWDSQLMNVHANDAYSEYFGKKPHEIKGQHISTFFGAELYKKSLPYLDAVLLGQMQTFEREFSTLDGVAKHTLVHYIPDIVNNKILGFFAIVTDITKVKELEKINQNHISEIQKNETKLNAIFNGTSDAIIILDKNKFDDCNESALQLFEIDSKEQFKDISLTDLSASVQVGVIDKISAIKKYIKLASENGSSQFEWVSKTMKGKEFPTEVLLSCFVLNGRHLLQGCIRDISDRKKQEQQILEQQKKLVASSKMSSLGEMASGIAHEINNPLVVINGKADYLLGCVEEDKIDKNRFKNDLSKIILTVNRIAKIIKGLKTFSRNAEFDPMEFIKISQIIEDVLELCKERFQINKVELHIQMKEDFTIYCRAAQIAQVIMNLLSNAHDAVEKYTDKWVELKVAVENQNCILTVTDSGNGIPADVVEKMMNPFFTTKEVGKGTGLGLSISKGIIADHGGILTYEPHFQNTQFKIVLPIRDKK